MRNKSAAVQGGRGSSQSKSAAEIPDVAAPAAISLATRVGLLAPGGPAPLPPLDEVRSRYSIYTGKKTLFRLCQNLVEEGLATTRSWEKSKADPLAFIDESLRRWCFLHGISRIEAEFQEFSVAIRDEGDSSTESFGAALAPGPLCLQSASDGARRVCEGPWRGVLPAPCLYARPLAWFMGSRRCGS